MTDTLAHSQLLRARRISRRKFVNGVGLAVAGAALLAVGGQVLRSGRLPEVPGEALVRSTFAGFQGEEFLVRPAAAAALPLRLAAVRDLPHASASAGNQQSFALLFRGPSSQPLDQATYRFEHSRIGEFVLFIVPMALDENARYYEAIFNRQRA